MGFLIGIIVIAFIIGLLSRKKGDNFLDTLSSGCGTIVWIIVLIAIAIFIFSQK
jgi:biotin transporter BioY